MESFFFADSSLLEEADSGKPKIGANSARAKIQSCLALLIKLFAK